MYSRQTRAHPARDPSGFSSTCSPRPGGDRGRAERGSPCRRSFASPLLILGPSVKRRRSDGKGRVPRTRGAPGRRAFGDRAGALPPNPSRSQRTGGFAAGAQPRVHFFGYFLCASKESDSSARTADETQHGRTPSQRAALKDKFKVESDLRRNEDKKIRTARAPPPSPATRAETPHASACANSR